MTAIQKQLLQSKALDSLLKNLEENHECSLQNFPCSAQAFIIASWKNKKLSDSLLLICPSIKWQEEMATHLEAWNIPHLFFPETLDLDEDSLSDPNLAAEKMTVLGALLENSHSIVLATESALNQKLPSPKQIHDGKLFLKKGDSISIEILKEKLAQANYTWETLVVERGQFTHRGGIVDCFSWQNDFPVRIEWLGNEIESIRKFDPVEQTSIEEISSAEIQLCAPNFTRKNSATLLDYFAKKPRMIFLGNSDSENKNIPEKIFESDFFEHTFLHGVYGDQILSENRKKLLEKYLRDWSDDEWQIAISCNNEGEQQRIIEWLKEEFHLDTEQFHFFISPLLRGFAWHGGRIALLTDAEIFGRYQTLRGLRKQRLAIERRKPADFSELELGDYVVHLDHGIALYHGVQQITSEEGEQSVLLLEFADEAKLYVPLEQAYLVSKYVGVGKRHPPLDILGGARWEKARQRAQKAVMDYAADLLRLHAERETFQRPPFGADSEWQQEFENAFFYKETPDQLKAIAETKSDMEKHQPTDRLICGDVGFGKTEIAIRAAFKAVMDGRQVAFLVPTTVLAQQHWNTLRERMADWPVKIEILSRFRTRAEQRETIQKIASGEADIVVGTHRLISNDVHFKNLGLVVVDEEQRFGVKQKEKLKKMFHLVDVITLTATPIPRTLYLALMGARDMSLIETPPPNRLPVETIVHVYDERIIRSFIERELERGGQIFFLHNRIRTIQKLADRLKLLIPKAKIDVGHGQMHEDDLEEVMNRFIEGKTDILLSTTIIENGLDIPNANTIIIDRADRFGLADLYQLRGRVGRSHHRAYALLLLPRDLIQGDAGKRVQAIRQYTQLGSGYKIAMRDLEIRGAGNLLGTQQSGHIAAIGFDLYCRLLKQAVSRLKGKTPSEIKEVYISLDFISLQQKENMPHAHIPASYMPQILWRISAYRELAELQTLSEWQKLRAQWKDRFGAWPEPVELLLTFHKIKISALAADIQHIEVKENKLMLKRNNDYIMIGNKFPRLTATSPKTTLLEIEKWILSFVKS